MPIIYFINQLSLILIQTRQKKNKINQFSIS